MNPRKILFALALLLSWIAVIETLTLPEKKSSINFPTTGARLLAVGFSPWLALGIWLDEPSKIEIENPDKTVHSIFRTVDLDPENLFFWINGAGIMGYDLSNTNNTSSNKTYPETAVELLKKGLLKHPNNPYLNYEIGKIYLLKLKRPKLAKEYFEKAASR